MFVEVRLRELVIIVGSNLLTTWVSTWGFLFSIKEYKILTVSLKKSRLVGWVSNTLMLSGKATLVQSVSSTIPSYSMQTMLLPASVCDRLDRLNRDFLWGDTPEKKKIHLVKWD